MALEIFIHRTLNKVLSSHYSELLSPCGCIARNPRIRPSRRVGIVTVGTLLYSLGFQEMTRDGSKNRKREAYQESLVHVWHTWSADRSQPIKLAIAAYFLCSASFLRQIRLNRRSRSISTFEVYSGCFRNNGYRDSRAYERLGSTERARTLLKSDYKW